MSGEGLAARKGRWRGRAERGRSSGGGANIEGRMNDAVGHDDFTIIGSFYEAPIQQDGHIFVQTLYVPAQFPGQTPQADALELASARSIPSVSGREDGKELCRRREGEEIGVGFSSLPSLDEARASFAKDCIVILSDLDRCYSHFVLRISTSARKSRTRSSTGQVA